MTSTLQSPSGTATLFKDVAFVLYPVADVKKSRAFYEDILGLAVTANWSDQWVEYDIGHGTLAITTADEKHHAGAKGVCIGLEVADLDQTLSRLKEKGLGIADAPYDSPVCRGCPIQDPDGNEIILHAKK